MKASPPSSFLRKVEETIAMTQKIPLWGSRPCFPWEALSLWMQKEINDPHFRIIPVLQEAMNPKDFLVPFGDNPKLFSFQLSPITAPITWVISKETLTQMTAKILQGPEIKDSSDFRFQEGFFQFLLLHVTKQIEDLKVYRDLHIQWVKEAEIPKAAAFVIDISIELYEQVFLSRLIISEEFQVAFASHFTEPSFNPLSSPISPKIDVLLKLEIGNCTLSQEEWHAVQVGDLLILDYCSYDPEAQKGCANLSWEETPYFKVKVRKNSLKIVDYAVYNGEQSHD
jgi:hypothetical protein